MTVGERRKPMGVSLAVMHFGHDACKSQLYQKANHAIGGPLIVSDRLSKEREARPADDRTCRAEFATDGMQQRPHVQQRARRQSLGILRRP